MLNSSRSLLSDTIAREPTARIPMTDIAFWDETVKRWECEGLSAGTDLYDHFGLDRIFLYYPGDHPRLTPRVVEEDDETVVVIDEWGRTVKKWKNKTATPVVLRCGVDAPDKISAYMERFEELDHTLVDEKQIENYHNSVNRGDFTAVCPKEPAWFVIEYLLGFEEGLTAFLTDPDEVILAMRALMDYNLRQLAWLIDVKGLRFDALWFFADLCFKNGMLFSSKVYRDLVMPLHREYKRFCDERGMFLMLHCCGDVREFVPLIIESGFQVIQPLEARAGNDVRQLKALYGNRITFMGNINADIIAHGTQDQIREEVVSKINMAKQGGGYIYHIDHSVPPTVSLENYSFMIRTIKEVAGL